MEIKGETAGMMKGSVRVQGEHERELSWCGLKTWLSGGGRRALGAGRRDWEQKGEQSPCMLSSKTFQLGKRRKACHLFHEGPR